MRLIVFLLMSSMAFAQVGTGNIKQTDVRTEMATSPNSLTGMVSRANSTGGWHSTYEGLHDRLSNFKGYNDSQITTYAHGMGIHTTNTASACGNPPLTRWTDSSSFSGANYIWTNSSGTNYAPAGYYSDGSTWLYWNGSSVTNNGLCSF